MVWAAQQGVEFKFTNKNLPLRKPKVPQQSNGSDCGVFLLHFIEKFCEEPHWNPQQVRTDLVLSFRSNYILLTKHHISLIWNGSVQMKLKPNESKSGILSGD